MDQKVCGLIICLDFSKLPFMGVLTVYAISIEDNFSPLEGITNICGIYQSFENFQVILQRVLSRTLPHAPRIAQLISILPVSSEDSSEETSLTPRLNQMTLLILTKHHVFFFTMFH